MTAFVTVVLDEYPHTAPILSGSVSEPSVVLELPTIRPVRSAFAAMVNQQEFDFCEMALATYVQARAAGSPITLLPVTMLARFQHPNLLHDIRRPLAGPEAVAGRRVGLQSYAQTTGMWMRGILSRQYGVGSDEVGWVALESPHVEGFTPPSNVTLAPEGSTMTDLLAGGAVDAAIVSRPLEDAQHSSPVFTDLESVTRDWYERTGVLQVNHVMCVRTELVDRDPATVSAVLGLFRRGRAEAGALPGPGPAWASGLDPVPFGLAALIPVLQLALDLCIEQQLVGPDLTIADLIHPGMPAIEAAAG